MHRTIRSSPTVKCYPTLGAPYAYVTTEKFLVEFGLKSLRDLPDIEALKDAGLMPADRSACRWRRGPGGGGADRTACWRRRFRVIASRSAITLPRLGSRVRIP